MRITAKQGVSLTTLDPVMFFALYQASRAYQLAGATELVVTSTTDGEHMPRSLHYRGLAVDLRLPPRASTDEVVSRLKQYLPQFDVILETTHVHVEYDPH